MKCHFFLIIFITYSVSADSISNKEIKPYIEKSIHNNSEKFKVPANLLQGLMAPYKKLSSLENIHITEQARDEIKNYITTHNIAGVSQSDFTTPITIDNYLKFMSISLSSHYQQLQNFFETNNLKVLDQNLWALSGISFQFGIATALAFINYCAKNITVIVLNRHILNNPSQFALRICSYQGLKECFTESMSLEEAELRSHQILQFLDNIHFCDEVKK